MVRVKAGDLGRACVATAYASAAWIAWAPSAAAAGPLPACPTGSPTTIDVAVQRGYQATRDATAAGAPCTLILVRQNPLPPGAADPNTSAVSIEFTGDGLLVHYDFTQPRGIRKDVPFGGIDLQNNDNVEVVLRDAAGHARFSATANAAAKCSSLNRIAGNQLNHAQCGAAAEPPESAALDPKLQDHWKGTLTIGWDVVAAEAMPRTLLLRVDRTVWHGSGKQAGKIVYHSGGSGPRDLASSTWLRVGTLDVAQRERYVGASSNAGYNLGIPPHRVAGSVFFPVDPHNALSASVSDDAGPLLTVRDASLKDIVPKAKAALFACVSCGSFQTERAAAFQPPFASVDVLGADFSALGVDNTPFAFDAAGFPIDSGFKALLFDESLAIATLNGTTPSGASARDGVIRAARRFDWETQTLRLGAEHVVANRSAAPSSSAVGSYAPIASTLTTFREY